MRTQREMLEHQIALEEEELAYMPEEEIEELATIYRYKGLDADTARRLAERIVSNPVEGLKTLAREELGLDPDSLASPTGLRSRWAVGRRCSSPPPPRTGWTTIHCCGRRPPA